jgi:predicted small lipoprotein YifL
MLHSKVANQTVILIVKPTSTLLISAAFLIGAVLQGCGQTGPLYMPKAPNRPVAATPDPVTVPPTTDNGIPSTIPAPVTVLPKPSNPAPSK